MSPMYMNNAGYAIDQAIKENGIELGKKESDVIRGKTSEGANYRALIKLNDYKVDYTFHRKKYSFVFNVDHQNLNDEMRRFLIASEIRKRISENELSEAIRRYNGEKALSFKT